MGDYMKVSIGVSNRHVHLKKEHLDILFGKDYVLQKRNDLNQPEQFAAIESVTIKTTKSQIENVRILGPLRDYTQVEISMTDAYKLGLNPPVRESGDLTGSCPITIIGPKGKIDLEKGCIIATRHIHLTNEQAKLYGLEDKKSVSVKLDGEKGGIINNVSLKVSRRDLAYFELHLDTDDANANLVKSGDIGEIL